MKSDLRVLNCHVATVQLLVRGPKSPEDANEFIHEQLQCLEEKTPTADGFKILDWSFLKVGGQRLSATPTWIDVQNYKSGDFQNA